MTNFNSAASRERIKRAQHFARRSLKKHESILRSSRGRFNHPISVPSTPEYSGFPYGNHQSRNRFGNTQGAQRHNTRRRCDTRRVIRQQTFAFPIRFRVRSRGRWRLLALPPPPSPPGGRLSPPGSRRIYTRRSRRRQANALWRSPFVVATPCRRESAAIRYTYTRGTRSGSLPLADPENKTIHSEVFTVGAREERNRARGRIHFRSARRFRRREKDLALV
jgi:hypothetical protein